MGTLNNYQYNFSVMSNLGFLKEKFSDDYFEILWLQFIVAPLQFCVNIYLVMTLSYFEGMENEEVEIKGPETFDFQICRIMILSCILHNLFIQLNMYHYRFIIFTFTTDSRMPTSKN